MMDDKDDFEKQQDEAASAPRMPPAAAHPALPADGATSLRS